jgi:hypothetical protein
MAQLHENNSNYMMCLLNQSPFQELYPVAIRNIRAAVYSQLFTVKTRKPLATKF